jgi:NitT/TauT family transport system substrate-binding protein
MNLNKTAIIIVSGIIILIGIILMLSIGFNTNNKNTMNVGYLPVLVNLPLFVGVEEGYFAEQSLELNLIEAQSPNNIVNALISGNLDAAGVLADNILFTAEEKYPNEIKIFATADETYDNSVAAIIVRPDSNIKDINELIGKKIGVYNGLVQVLFLKAILVGANINPNSVNIIEIAPNLQLQGLNAKQFDALSTVEPYVTMAIDKNIGKILIDNPRVKYIQEPFPSVATPISKEFIDKYPNLAKAYVIAYNQAIDFIKNNPEKAKEYLVKYTPIDLKTAKLVNIPKFIKFGDENRINIQKYANWMTDYNLIPGYIDVNSMFGAIN